MYDYYMNSNETLSEYLLYNSGQVFSDNDDVDTVIKEHCSIDQYPVPAYIREYLYSG